MQNAAKENVHFCQQLFIKLVTSRKLHSAVSGGCAGCCGARRGCPAPCGRLGRAEPGEAEPPPPPPGADPSPLVLHACLCCGSVGRCISDMKEESAPALQWQLLGGRCGLAPIPLFPVLWQLGLEAGPILLCTVKAGTALQRAHSLTAKRKPAGTSLGWHGPTRWEGGGKNGSSHAHPISFPPSFHLGGLCQPHISK